MASSTIAVTPTVINARGLPYRELNALVKEAVAGGATEIILENVNGQRYIGTGVPGKVNITIKGVPGNDLGAFLDGPTITVLGNGQDAIANTMNAGKIVVHGHAGDVLGYGMRGGKLFVKGDVGYRVGIHMKAFKSQVPVIIVGGTARDFFGEYMAGGILVLLGLGANGRSMVGDYCGTGMHGGAMYLRGKVDPFYLGKEVSVSEPGEEDLAELRPLLEEYCRDLQLDPAVILSEPFIKLVPVSHRPYGKLYCY